MITCEGLVVLAFILSLLALGAATLALHWAISARAERHSAKGPADGH
jgi:hypothetical protein